MTNENEQVTLDTSDQETEEVAVEEATTEDVEETTDWEAEAKKAQEVADNYKKRAEKAERKAKETKPTQEASTLSQMDVIALAKADIHEEDMERVTKFAQMEGLSVKDALGNPDMQAILERRAETRQAAAAANTGSGKSSQPTKDGAALLQEAQKGNMPDVEDLEKMWDAKGTF